VLPNIDGFLRRRRREDGTRVSEHGLELARDVRLMLDDDDERGESHVGDVFAPALNRRDACIKREAVDEKTRARAA
jgi:hypothetical protein